MTDTTAIDEKTTRWAAAGRLARWLLGALSLVGGLTWILFTTHGPTAVLDLTVGVVFAAAGLVLLMPHRIRLPRLIATIVMTMVAIAGTAAGLAVDNERAGSYAYVIERGFPFTWVQRYAVADNPVDAERLARAAHWTVDLVSLGTSLLFWAYAGMMLVVIAELARRRRA
ncbi:hypothetical protein [Paractinoplanes globisporus]|uniref:Uncharacterized protein n=1 Tax=Paractinoplanes globisporus TaxID=113565 RepID=A0ABW6WL25_9ACTN|nr:hypothetical protein [Actinoplanes globisporus]